MTARPQPRPVAWDKGFWELAREGRLGIQECGRCGHRQTYPRPRCLRCSSQRLGWHVSSGRGRLYSFTVVRVPIHPAFRGDAPILLADVELEEGVRMLARLVDCDVDDPRIDAPVQIVFRPNEEGGTPVPCAVLAEVGSS